MQFLGIQCLLRVGTDCGHAGRPFGNIPDFGSVFQKYLEKKRCIKVQEVLVFRHFLSLIGYKCEQIVNIIQNFLLDLYMHEYCDKMNMRYFGVTE